MPFIGRVADWFGPRWALGVGASSGFAVAIAAICYLSKFRHLCVRIRAGRLGFTLDEVLAKRHHLL